jgi:hypothetical protein
VWSRVLSCRETECHTISGKEMENPVFLKMNIFQKLYPFKIENIAE